MNQVFLRIKSEKGKLGTFQFITVPHRPVWPATFRTQQARLRRGVLHGKGGRLDAIAGRKSEKLRREAWPPPALTVSR